MSKHQWNVSFSPVAVRDKYKIARGEAALFRDAVAVLYESSQPEGAMAIAGAPNTFEYARSGYLIAYEVIVDQRTNRIIHLERQQTTE